MSRPFISVVVPVYCSANGLPEFYRSLDDATRGMDAEFIFVDDASPDKSAQVLEKLALKDTRVKAVILRRNIGQQEATLYGTQLAKGQYIAHLDDDGQNPPALLGEMVRRLCTEGLDIVYAVAEGQERAGGRARDAVFRRMFPQARDVKVSAYRVMTFELAQTVLSLRGKFNYFSATALSAGARAGYISYPYVERAQGRSGYSFFKRSSLFIKIIWYYWLCPKSRTGVG